MRQIIPAPNAVKIYALVWIVFYLVLYFVLRDMLPEKYLRDSMTIQKLADNTQSAADWGGAYNIAALVASIVPLWALNLLVAATGCTTIWLFVTSLRSLRGIALTPFILLPVIILDMVQFGKEVFIIPITFFVLWVAQKMPALRSFFVIVIIYAIYGAFFREYYLIIMMAYIGLLAMMRSPPPFRLGYLLILLVMLVLIPAHSFMDLQGSRDEINRLSNLLTNEVRTAIYNKYIPDNGFHFVLNYIYVFLKLNVPLLFDQTMNEVILTVNILVYGRLIYVGAREGLPSPAALLAWLFLSHVLVLAIFEPDSGSYFRHFSSVVVYLIPALRIVEQRYAQRLLQQAARAPAS